mgnify:CR=1 FL=1
MLQMILFQADTFFLLKLVFVFYLPRHKIE